MWKNKGQFGERFSSEWSPSTKKKQKMAIGSFVILWLLVIFLIFPLNWARKMEIPNFENIIIYGIMVGYHLKYM